MKQRSSQHQKTTGSSSLKNFVNTLKHYLSRGANNRYRAELMRSVLASIDDLVISIDLQGMIRFAHAPVGSPHHLNARMGEEGESIHFRNVLPTELVEHLESTIPTVIQKMQPQQFEYSLVIPTKGEHHFSARVSPLHYSGNTVTGVTLVVRDITAVVVIGAREERMFELETLSHQITKLCLEAPNAETIAPTLLTMLGESLGIAHADVYTFHTTQGKSESYQLQREYRWNSNLNPYHDAPGLDLYFLPNTFVEYLDEEGSICTPRTQNYPVHVQNVIKTWRVGSVLILPYYKGDELDGILVLYAGNPERVWAPEEVTTMRMVAESYARLLESDIATKELIAARDAALQSSRSKSDFMSNMSHEIRTPIGALFGMLELLNETELTAHQRELTAFAINSSRRLLNIVDDILDFAKLEERRVPLESLPVDIRSLIEEIHTSYTPAAQKKGIVFATEIETAVPNHIMTDPTRLRQVINNLVSNAIKFTEKGGIAINVNADRVMTDQIHMRFVVSDTGIGIPEDQLESVFHSFVQADASTTRRYGGTGLGLAICKEIAALMDGSLMVTSELGKGSAFTFKAVFKLPEATVVPSASDTVEWTSIPATPLQRPPLEQIEALSSGNPYQTLVLYPSRTGSKAQEQKPFVLVADDDLTNQRLIMEVLHTLDVQVVLAQNGHEVLDQLANQEFRMLILDLHMPNMDGLTTARAIRKGNHQAHIPILFLTASVSLHRDADNPLQALLDAELDAILYKPFSISDLRSVVRKWLGRPS